MKIGFIGLGNMGLPMAINLLKAGYEVTVTDLNKDNAKKLIAAGAKWADTAREVAANSDAVITCLPSPKVSMAVLTGKDGILAGLKKGGTWIENSTNGKEEIEAMARREAFRPRSTESPFAHECGGVASRAQQRGEGGRPSGEWKLAALFAVEVAAQLEVAAHGGVPGVQTGEQCGA